MTLPEENVEVNKEPVLFSIIVVACNVARYVKDAIDSIKNQTIHDFEVLVVCEESTDDTLEICHAECGHDERFVIYPLPCSGSPSNARNLGMKSAKGRHAIFLDGDDWLEPNAVERFQETLLKTDYPDIIFASYSEYREELDGTRLFNDCRFNLSKGHEGEVFSGQEAIIRMGREKRMPMMQTYMGVYRLEFLLRHDVMQVAGLRYEDMEWSPRAWFFAQRVTVLNFPYYNYRVRSCSITTELTQRTICDWATVFDNLFDFYFTHDLSADLKKAWASQWLSTFFWYFYNVENAKRFSKDNRKKALAGFLRHQGFKRYISMTKETTMPKRLSVVPLAFYYWFDIEFPTKLYFRCFYYPFSRMREKLKRGT